MKKLIALLLTLTLLCSLSSFLISCNEPDDYQLKIGFLNGPTGMGMAKLINDNGGKDGNEKYSFEATTAELVGPGVVSGKFDVACMPTNTAAMLYNQGNDLVILAVNC